MKTLRLLTLSIVAGATLTITSCGGGEEQVDTGPKYNYEKADSLPTGYLEKLGVVKANIEVTAKLFAHMNEKGYAFNESILLPAGKSYSGSTKQAMGIGATGSDLVYTASFGQNQSAMSRMKGLVDLSNSLGVGDAFDEELMTKMASDDSTINKSILLTKAYLNAKDQLFSEERAQYATFMVVGGWLEGLHLGCQMAKDNISDKEIRVGFWEMTGTYGDILSMCKVFEASNPDMANMVKELHAMDPVLNKVRNNAKKYSKEDVAALAEAVSKVRSSML